MARKKPEEPHENIERWLVSYADFITLLFAFFVVLYAMSSLNEGKYKTLSESLVAAFEAEPRTLKPIEVGEVRIIKAPNVVNEDNTTAQADDPDMTFNDAQSVMNLEIMANEIESAMQGMIQKDLIQVTKHDNWIEVEINTSVLFGSGSARLADDAYPILQQLAGILRPFPNPVNVEGYTDNFPIKTDQFPSNWELSAARAASVVHLFSRERMSPRRMAAIGYGEHRPVADNTSLSGRLKNRRVVLAILADDNTTSRGSMGTRQAPPTFGGPQAAPPSGSSGGLIKRAIN